MEKATVWEKDPSRDDLNGPPSTVPPSYNQLQQPGAPGYGVQTGAPGYGVQPGAPGYGVQPGAPGYGVQPGAPGYGVQPGAPGYSVQPGAPGYGVQPGAPGYGVQPGAPGYGVQPGAPGYGVQPVALGYSVQVPPVQGMYGVQQTTQVTIIRQRPNNYLCLSIFVCLCCCLPFGIVGIVYSADSSSKFDRGDDAGALASANAAKSWSIAGLVCGVIWITIYIILQVTVFATSTYDDGYY